MSKSILAEFSFDRFEFYDEFHRIRSATGFTFLLSAISGGKIYFESESGKGSTFTVKLPL